MMFRTPRLSASPPQEDAAPIYIALFGEIPGKARLLQDIQNWSRHRVAPWVLSHAGNTVGVAGFRIGFGDDGLELSFHFLPEVWGQGLASEFVQAALDHAAARLREDRFFADVEAGNTASIRVLEKAGFTADDPELPIMRMRLRPTPPQTADPVAPDV